MGLNVLKTYEYYLECDCCGAFETFHTNDTGQDGIIVHNIPTAIKGGQYHRSKGKLLCNDCFKKVKE